MGRPPGFGGGVTVEEEELRLVVTEFATVRAAFALARLALFSFLIRDVVFAIVSVVC